jgi:YaiO family outer membrane protein
MRLKRHIIAALGCVALCVSASGFARAQTVEELYNKGVKARLEQRFDEAADFLNRALALQPDNADAILQLGFVELARDTLPAAEADFSKVLEIAPAYPDAKFGLAQVAFRKGDLDRARSFIAPLAKAQPDNKEFADLLKSVTDAQHVKKTAGSEQQRQARGAEIGRLMELATRQRISRQYAQAEKNYRRAVTLDPRNTDALTGLGLIAGARRDYAAASGYFRATLAIDGRNLDARLGMARLAVWQSDLVTARTRIDRILADAPHNSEALLLDGQISLIEDNYDRAEEAYHRVLAAQPNYVDALIGLGDVLRAKGDAEGARAAYGKALALDPTSTVIRDRLAAPFPTKWRLDVGSEISDLSSGRNGTWTDSFVSINYRPDDMIAVGARTRTVTRFGHTDVQLDMRTDYNVDRRLSVYGEIAGTPEADILAQYFFGGGASWQVVPKHDALGPFYLNLDARYDHFADSEIVTASPWAQAFLFGERLGLSARWVHVADDQDTTVDGYVLRGDVRLADTVLLFGGYSDAPEISEGDIIDTETIFSGLSVDLNDALTLRGSYAYETRSAFDRDIYGLSLTVRF